MQVEIKTTPKTVDIGHLQKAADFVHAFILGEAYAQLSTMQQCADKRYLGQRLLKYICLLAAVASDHAFLTGLKSSFQQLVALTHYC